MKFNFSENMNRVFSKEGNDFEGFKKFFYDYTHGYDVFDEEGNKVSNKKANERINNVMLDLLGFEQGYVPTRREIKRQMRKDCGLEVFEVLEETIDIKVETGFQDNEFFNQYVDRRNLAQGDKNEFWTPEKVILSVAKVSGGHHDLTMQKLGEGKSFSVGTYNLGIKVGMDIDLYLTGRRDWTELVDKIAEAYQIEVQNDIFTAFYAAADKLPTDPTLVVTDALTDNKEAFDELIADVRLLNNNKPVIIMGLETDLKKLNTFADVDWATLTQKEQYAAMGRLGTYESTDLVQIPQRLKNNDIANKLITPGTLFIMPAGAEDKFIKMVDVGETDILQVTDKGERNDDFMTYEVQREMGIEVILGSYFGVWNIE